MRKLTRALRTAALLAAAVLAFEIGAVGGVMAEPCVWGTNRPGIDTNPAVRTDPNASRMRCDMTVTEHTDPRDGHKFKGNGLEFLGRQIASARLQLDMPGHTPPDEHSGLW